MPRPHRALAVLGVLVSLGAAGSLSAQASSYIPLDDPSLPLLEHLIARGDIEDPSPMVRPFRRSDAVRVLADADTTGAAGAMVARLRRIYTDSASEAAWRVEPRAGIVAYSQARRDPLHPVGAAGLRPYVELAAQATFDNLVLATRPALDPRIVDDPDWPGRRDSELGGRLREGYIGAQFRFAHLLYGQLDHNWGPVGLPGIPLSGYGEERQGLAVEIGTRSLRLTALATDLRDEVDSRGQTIHRYYFVHRLAARLTRRLDVALWEGIVLSGAGRNFESRYRNPLSISYLANTVGLGDRGNVMLGADASWRAFGTTTFQAQLAVDDFWYQDRQRNRDRWALTLASFGPLGPRLSWRAAYTQVSSLALRAFNPHENFTDAGVGLGRNFSDTDRLSLWVAVPARTGWLLTPELTVQRQGEGRINDPYPVPDANGVLDAPALFIGTVECTYRAALGVTGQEGPLRLSADGGVHHIVNERHQPGRDVTRFEGRLQVTLGFAAGGSL